MSTPMKPPENPGIPAWSAMTSRTATARNPWMSSWFCRSAVTPNGSVPGGRGLSAVVSSARRAASHRPGNRGIRCRHRRLIVAEDVLRLSRFVRRRVDRTCRLRTGRSIGRSREGPTTRGGKRLLPTARRVDDSWARSSTTTVLTPEEVEKVLTTQGTRTFVDAGGPEAGGSERGISTPVAVAPPGMEVEATTALAVGCRGVRGGT